MIQPNFLIIGDLKAGTTSMHSYLAQHPEIFMPVLKELRFFAYDAENPYHAKSRAYRVRSYDEYLDYFTAAANKTAIGEVSPNYLRSPCAAQNIKLKLPHVKLIVCLRNPADMLYSLYMMHVRSGETKKPLEQQFFGHDATWIKGYAYWNDLKRYYDRFDRDQIKVIVFDDLVGKTLDTVGAIFRHIGVDPSFVPDLAIKNRGVMPKNLLFYRFSSSLARRLNKTLSSVPALEKRWQDVKELVKGRYQPIAKLDPLVRRKILEIAADDIVRTQELAQVDLTRWLP